MEKDIHQLLSSLTDRHKKVILAFKAPYEPTSVIAKRTGLSLEKAKETLEELIEMGLVSCP